MGFFDKVKNAVANRAGDEAAKKIRGDQNYNQGYSQPSSSRPGDPAAEARRQAHEREMEEQAMQMEKQAMAMSSEMMKAQTELMKESTRTLKDYNDKNAK